MRLNVSVRFLCSVTTPNVSRYQHADHKACHHGDWHVLLPSPDASIGRHSWVSLTWLLAKIKVETTPGANARSIKRRVRHIERQMGRLTENDKMTEMRKKKGQSKGRKRINTGCPFLWVVMNFWRVFGNWSMLISVISSSRWNWQVTPGHCFLCVTIPTCVITVMIHDTCKVVSVTVV